MYADYIRRKCRTCTEKRIRDDDFKEGYENDIIEESCEINNTNHIIEVKSNYTFYKEHQKNYFKFKSVINNRSFLRLMIYNEKKVLYEFICKTIDDLEKMFNEIDQIKF